MPVYPYGDRVPRIDPTAFVAPGARVVGDVELGPRVSVWFNAVVRGDADAIRVAADTNIQDGAVLHADAGAPCIVGRACTIGHRAVVHGCRVEDGCLVGMGAVVLNGAVIGDRSLIGAGSLIPPGKTFAPRSLIVGSPATVVRELSDEEIANLIEPGVAHYRGYAKIYRPLHLTD